jgi:hypothetical protein
MIVITYELQYRLLNLSCSFRAVSWDEFANYILAAGNASDANASKQEAGSLLEGPEPRLCDVAHGAAITHMCCSESAERFVTVALEDHGSGKRREAMSLIRMWNASPDACGEYLVPTAKLTGLSAHVTCIGVLDKSAEWKAGRVHVVAVASVDGVRFYELEKLALLGHMDLLSSLCTSMTSFSFKCVDAGVGEAQRGRARGGNGGEEEAQEGHGDTQAVFAWGDRNSASTN